MSPYCPLLLLWGERLKAKLHNFVSAFWETGPDIDNTQLNNQPMRKYLTMLVLLVAGFTAFAQQHSVKGTVVDSQGYPVIGMTVMEKGTQNGTTTDADGNYLLNLSSQGGQ